MTSIFNNKYVVWIGLILLVVSAFFIRLDGHRNAPAMSIDEVVYYRMAKQVVSEGLSGYNTIPYGEELLNRGRKLPQYFFEPLFKHPPVFTFLNALSLKLFGQSKFSAVFVSVLFGVFLIPLTYFLSKEFVDKKAALFSAFLLWMDPITIICSQKIWMDTTIAFFIVLSIYFFIVAVKQQKSLFFLYSGIALGFGVNTKYSAILPFFIFLSYALLCERSLFRRKNFWIGASFPFLMLVPWIAWNWKVMGDDFVEKFLFQHAEIARIVGSYSTENQLWMISVVLIIAMALILVFRRIQRLKPEQHYFYWEKNVLYFFSFVFLGSFFFLLKDYLMKAFDPFALPFVSWESGIYRNEPGWFYFGHLLEYSLFFIFAYIGWLRYQSKDHKEWSIVRLSIAGTFIFFILWGNFQSRYVLAVIPFLLVCGVKFLSDVFIAINEKDSIVLRMGYSFLIITFVVYGLLKTALINILLSFPNDMCYF